MTDLPPEIVALAVEKLGETAHKKDNPVLRLACSLFMANYEIAKTTALLERLKIDLSAIAGALAAMHPHPVPCGTEPCTYCWVEGMVEEASTAVATACRETKT